MKKKSLPFVFLALFLLTLFYLPNPFVQKMRSGAKAIFKQFWQNSHIAYAPSSPYEKELQALETSNLLLKKQNEMLRHRLLSEERIQSQINKIKEISSIDEERLRSFYKRRKSAAEKQLELELFALPAEVICRDPSSWSSTLWVNVGTRENEELNEKVIAIGSPVLKGPFLIGMVERVEKHRSQVRLLTDASLVPSVRVARDVKNLETGVPKLLLAKGELIGSRGSFLRGRSSVLRGVGFNYDFDDEEGPARELRSGTPLNQLNSTDAISLIDLGDLLVTTGMDGIFPKDLPVAYVTDIAPLKEGSPSCDIEAKLCAGDLNDLLDVTVLPPLTP